MIDYIAGLIELIGLITVGKKNKFGFLINMLSNAMWICLACKIPAVHGLLLVVVPAFFINFYNFNKWRKVEKNERT